MPDTQELAGTVKHLGKLALAFGRIDRTACWHPDGEMRESDTDHTVMLGWVACSLARALYRGRLDLGLVAELALAHDAVEVYAGDTPTLRIDAAGYESKRQREAVALDRLHSELDHSAPWLPRLASVYEHQYLPEARFVRAVDKMLPKIVHLLDGAKGLVEEGMTSAELRATFDRQTADMATYASEWPELLELRLFLVEQTIALLEKVTAGDWQLASDGRFYPREFLLHGHEREGCR